MSGPRPCPGAEQGARVWQGSQVAGNSGHLASMVQVHLLLSYPSILARRRYSRIPVFSYLVFLSSALEKEMATHSSILAW